MSDTSYTQGFSTIELMISLFIAVMFVATGYQLYSAIMTDGAEVRQRAHASGIAYEHLRVLSDKPTGTCRSYTFSPTPTLSATDRKHLPESATLSVAASCPYGTTSNIWRVTVTIAYGTPTEEISHAIFVAR